MFLTPSFQLAIVFFTFLVLTGPPVSNGQTDDFNDGNDAGWTHMDPLTEAGVPPGTFSFPDGDRYRFQHAASPNPDELGVARIGSYRPDIVQGNFVIQIDVVNWDDREDQNIGILARINDPGLGSTGGYALTLDTSEQALYLSLIDFEIGSILGEVALSEPADPDTGFRLIFRGNGDEFTGDIFSLNDPGTSLATIEGFDNLFESGSPGIFSSNDPADGKIDVTFDNFVAFDPDKPPVEPIVISEVRRDTKLGLLLITFNFTEGAGYLVEKSADLVDWKEIEADFDQNGDEATFEVPVIGPGQAPEESAYFRIRPDE